MDELGAGNFPVDGRMSFTGSSINSIACSVILNDSEGSLANASQNPMDPGSGSGMTNCGVLMIQNSPLAQAVNFFNGKVSINKEGQLASESLALGNQSLGEAIIPEGQTEITINSSIITPDSRIFLTPISPVLGNLYLGETTPGQSFRVKLSTPNLSDVKFNWIIVQSKEAP